MTPNYLITSNHETSAAGADYSRCDVVIPDQGKTKIPFPRHTQGKTDPTPTQEHITYRYDDCLQDDNTISITGNRVSNIHAGWSKRCNVIAAANEKANVLNYLHTRKGSHKASISTLVCSFHTLAHDLSPDKPK